MKKIFNLNNLFCDILFLVLIVSSDILSKASEDGECKKDSECDLKNSVCINSKCVCKGGYVMTGDMTQCIQGAAGFSEACEDSVQCSYTLKTGGHCKNGSCVCADGFHYLQGRCWKTSGLGKDCTHNENCYVNYDFESASCNANKKCQCAEGYYQREYSSCRRKAGHGEPCGIALDCQFKNAICTVDRKCADKNKTNLKSFTKYILLNPTIFTGEMGNVKPSDTVEGRKVGDSCEKNADCQDIPNSICNEAGICSCESGFYSSTDKTKCFAEIGSTCKNDNDCVGKNMMCRIDKGWCTCKAGFVTSIDNRFCDKQSRYLNWSCLTDRWCSFFGPGGVCINKKCHCSPSSHYVEESFYCWSTKKVNESCSVDLDCGPNSQAEKCQGGICSCMSGNHPSSDLMTCNADSKNPGDPCHEDQDCVYSHGACNASICTCSKGYLAYPDGCHVGIGGDCNGEQRCSVEGSSCNSSGKCVCDNGRTPSLNETKCLPEASKYKDVCEEPQQCRKLLGEGSECEGGLCTCQKGYHFFEEGFPCLIDVVLGDKCHRDAECIHANTSCINSHCHCKPNFHVYNHTCINGAEVAVLYQGLIFLVSFIFIFQST